MTPGARISAAIEILDDMADGLAAEQALTRWSRRSRFAGSKDRAAVRDHVFDVLRCRSMAAHLGQGSTGRALLIGLLRLQDADLDALFDGAGHAPEPLSDAEKSSPETPSDITTGLNLPAWLWSHFEQSLGAQAAETAQALQQRAPITLRVNLAKTTRGDAVRMLADEGVETVENPLAAAALTITDGPRKLRNSKTFSEGYVELQDAASQAVAACLPDAGKVLDYCAGGGGKALALAMDPARQVFAHDIAPQRMADLPARASRAGAQVTHVTTSQIASHAPYDVVLCDAPCSGSGAWRRAAEAKWTLTPERLEDLTHIQDQILDEAMAFVATGGVLAYATCSVLEVENEARVAAFLKRHPGWQQVHAQRFAVNEHGDGFFTAHLIRDFN